MTCWIAWTAGSVFGAATGPMRGTDGMVVGAAAAIGGVETGLKFVVTKRSTAKPISALNRATPTSEAAMLQRRGLRSGCASGGGGGDAPSSSGRQSEGLLGNMGVLRTPFFPSLDERY